MGGYPRCGFYMNESELCPFVNECVSKEKPNCIPEFRECMIYSFYLQRDEKEKNHQFDISDLDVNKINKLPEHLGFRLERFI
jgi:hypothetical protein